MSPWLPNNRFFNMLKLNTKDMCVITKMNGSCDRQKTLKTNYLDLYCWIRQMCHHNNSAIHTFSDRITKHQVFNLSTCYTCIFLIGSQFITIPCQKQTISSLFYTPSCNLQQDLKCTWELKLFIDPSMTWQGNSYFIKTSKMVVTTSSRFWQTKLTG